MGICHSKSASIDANVLMIGLDGAGKTTIFRKLNDSQAEDEITLPTIGFNVNRLHVDGVNMTLWDVGGQSSIRALWTHYFRECSAIIFVVDSNDRGRIKGDDETESAVWWIEKLSQMKELDANCAFLILANKQDQNCAMSTSKIIDALDLCGKFRGRTWHVQPTVAITNEGIPEAFHWLARTLHGIHSKSKSDTLSTNCASLY